MNLNEFIIQLERQAVAFEQDATTGCASDRLRAKTRAALTRTIVEQLKAVIITNGAEPILSKLTAESMKTFAAEAQNKGTSITNAFRTACNAFVHAIAPIEKEMFGGILLTQIIQDYLNQCPWVYIDSAITYIAENAQGIPRAMPCNGRYNCVLHLDRVGNEGMQIACRTHGKKGPTQPTELQAVAEWNRAQRTGERIELGEKEAIGIQPGANDACAFSSCTERPSWRVRVNGADVILCHTHYLNYRDSGFDPRWLRK